MEGYLGEFPTTCDMTKEELALYYIESYGSIDGAHHKSWVLDQIARILNDTPVICAEARWDSGYTDLRVRTGEPSQKYLDWVSEMRGEWDSEYQEYEYYYDEGIAP